MSDYFYSLQFICWDWIEWWNEGIIDVNFVDNLANEENQ